MIVLDIFVALCMVVLVVQLVALLSMLCGNRVA